MDIEQKNKADNERPECNMPVAHDGAHTSAATPTLDLTARLRKRRLKYAGHVLRRPEIEAMHAALLSEVTQTEHGLHYEIGGLLVDAPRQMEAAGCSTMTQCLKKSAKTEENSHALPPRQ